MAEDRQAYQNAVVDEDISLLDWIVELTTERDAYRLIAVQAIHHCHEQYVELTRLRSSRRRAANDSARS